MDFAIDMSLFLFTTLNIIDSGQQVKGKQVHSEVSFHTGRCKHLNIHSGYLDTTYMRGSRNFCQGGGGGGGGVQVNLTIKVLTTFFF